MNRKFGMKKISFFFLMIRRPPRSTLFPTRRSSDLGCVEDVGDLAHPLTFGVPVEQHRVEDELLVLGKCHAGVRSEEHTSELQSPCNLVCRLLLEKKKFC